MLVLKAIFLNVQFCESVNTFCFSLDSKIVPKRMSAISYSVFLGANETSLENGTSREYFCLFLLDEKATVELTDAHIFTKITSFVTGQLSLFSRRRFTRLLSLAIFSFSFFRRFSCNLSVEAFAFMVKVQSKASNSFDP